MPGAFNFVDPRLAAVMAPMMADRPSGLQIESGDRGNNVESGLALKAHRLKSK
jgi:hypothetical protein